MAYTGFRETYGAQHADNLAHRLRSGGWSGQTPADLTAPAARPLPAAPSGRAQAGQQLLPGLGGEADGPSVVAADPWLGDAAEALSDAERRTVAAALDVLRFCPADDLTGGGRIYYLTDADQTAAHAHAAAMGIPVGALAQRAAWGEFVAAATTEPRRQWPQGRRRFQRAARMVARARAAEPGAWQPHGAFEDKASGVKVLATSVDWLKLGIHAQIVGVTWDRLWALRELARVMRDRPIWLAAGPHRWRVSGYAAGDGPYLMTLAGPAYMLKIGRHHANSLAPQVMAEIRAEWLWRQGPDRAADELIAGVKAWSMAGVPVRVNVSRIDLCADVQGLEFTGTELPEGRWVTRAVRRAAYYTGRKQETGNGDGDHWLDAEARAAKYDRPKRKGAADRANRQAEKQHREWLEAEATDVLWWRGRDFNGSHFGPGGRVQFRCYRKDREIQKPGGSVWLPAVWERSGLYDEAAPVWRLEAEISGALLKSLVAAAVDGEERVKQEPNAKARRLGSLQEWRNLRRLLGGLWRYIVGDPARDNGGWLTLREGYASGRAVARWRGECHRKGIRRPHRWPIDPRWRAVQRCAFGLGGVAEDVARRGAVARLGDGRHVTKAQRDALTRGEWTEAAWAQAQTLGDLCDREGQPLRPEDAATLAEVIGSAAVLETWGRGPDRQAVQRLAGAGFEIQRAEHRAEIAEAQTRGTLAWWVSEAMAAAGDVGGDPVEWARRNVGQLLGEAFRGRVEEARLRQGLRGAIRLARQAVHDTEAPGDDWRRLARIADRKAEADNRIRPAGRLYELKPHTDRAPFRAGAAAKKAGADFRAYWHGTDNGAPCAPAP